MNILIHILFDYLNNMTTIKGFTGRNISLTGKTWLELTDTKKEFLIQQAKLFDFLSKLRTTYSHPCAHVGDNPLIVTEPFMQPHLHRFIINDSIDSSKIELSSPIMILTSLSSTENTSNTQHQTKFNLDSLSQITLFGNFSITIVPINIYYPDIGHKSLLLINHIQKEIEFFDSTGVSLVYYDFEIPLKTELTNRFPEYRFVELQEFCPLIGPQQNNNTCALWTLLYQKLRIEFPNLNRRNLVQEMFNQPNKLIFGFHCYLIDRLENVYSGIQNAFYVFEHDLRPLIDRVYEERPDRVLEINNLYELIVHDLTSFNSETYKTFVNKSSNYLKRIRSLFS